jgi:hypothetical protein
MKPSIIASRAVAMAVVAIVGIPSVNYSFIIGGELGWRASFHSYHVVSEDVGFLGGSIVGGAVAVVAFRFLAISAWRLSAWAFSTSPDSVKSKNSPSSPAKTE